MKPMEMHNDAGNPLNPTFNAELRVFDDEEYLIALQEVEMGQSISAVSHKHDLNKGILSSMLRGWKLAKQQLLPSGSATPEDLVAMYHLHKKSGQSLSAFSHGKGVSVEILAHVFSAFESGARMGWKAAKAQEMSKKDEAEPGFFKNLLGGISR